MLLLLCSIILNCHSNEEESHANNFSYKTERSAMNHVFRESIPLLTSRRDLVKKHRVEPDHPHEVIFVIAQRNIDELTSILHDLSDPLSVNYGQHWSSEEVADFTSNLEARDAVVAYLHAEGASIVSETLHGEYITANAPVVVWEKMFRTVFYWYDQGHRDNSFDTILRAEEYWIPKELDMHVASVLRTIDTHPRVSKAPRSMQRGFGTKQNLQNKHASAIGPGYITPTDLRNYYNMSMTTKGSTASTQMIFAGVSQYFSPTDILTFQTEYGVLPGQPVAASINNHSSDAKCLQRQENCHEANLDLEYIMTTSPESPTTFWYTDGWFDGFLRDVSNSLNLPRVISISYASQENLVSKGSHDSFTTQAIKLGTMGVTIVASSGDDGANSYDVGNYGIGSCNYQGIFPATSPYVLAVGGTAVSAEFYGECH